MHESKKAALAAAADRISALTDSLLSHVLSFLQAREAVQSCVLARRWRHLWRSLPVLRLTDGRPILESHEFMDHLLVLRDRSPLHACLFDFFFGLDIDSDRDFRYLRLWIRRTRISTPNLISLQLTAGGAIPLLEEMPVFVTATVTDVESGPCFICGDASCQCCHGPGGSRVYCGDVSCECCYGRDDVRAGCVLLNGLSAATNLKLIAKSKLITILKRDLRRCPTFRKLKTLLLSEWCVAADYHALVCILQHSPVLESLTLELPEEPIPFKPRKATYNLFEHSSTSENLKVVEVTCQEVNDRVNNVMKSLTTYGIPLEKINIRQTNKSSECFNFVCTGFSSKQGGEDLGP